MYMIPVNLWAILVSAIASMVVGSIWYGPLFGKKFIKESGMDQWSDEKKNAEKKKMGVTYFIQFVASLVMFYFLAIAIYRAGLPDVWSGMSAAFFVWIGFVVPVKLGDAIWGGKMSLFWLGIGNMHVTLLVAGAILGGWQ